MKREIDKTKVKTIEDIVDLLNGLFVINSSDKEAKTNGYLKYLKELK